MAFWEPQELHERIVAAAVRFECQTFSLLPPARHGEVLRLMFTVFGDEYIGKEEQGFVTSHHRFVDRDTGKHIARQAGQLLPSASKISHLFSEDIW